MRAKPNIGSIDNLDDFLQPNVSRGNADAQFQFSGFDHGALPVGVPVAERAGRQRNFNRLRLARLQRDALEIASSCGLASVAGQVHLFSRVP